MIWSGRSGEKTRPKRKRKPYNGKVESQRRYITSS
jgi:hypothetical protein